MIEILLHGWWESICLILYTPENFDANDTNHLKPTLLPPKKVQHLTRTEKFAITLHIIGHTKATKSEILLRWSPTSCQNYNQTDHWTHDPWVYSVTAKLWSILHSWLIEDPLCDESWGFHSTVFTEGGFAHLIREVKYRGQLCISISHQPK